MEEGLNTPDKIKERLRTGRLPRRGVLLMVPARFAFAIVVFILVCLLEVIAGATKPLQAAGAWWLVSGTLIDLGCLAVLTILVRREGISLLDLLNLDRRHIWRDLLIGLPLILALIPALVVIQVLQTVFYPGQLPPQIALVHLPLWATIYSIVVWPAVWAFTEQTTYVGYLLPRLEVLTKRRWFAGSIVVFFWAIQHIALPFVPEARYLFVRTVSAGLVAITAVVLYWFVLRRRLLPLIVVHWFGDALAALTPLLLVHH